MVELMLAVTILAIAVCGFASSIVSALVLNRVNRETTVALQAARDVLEELHAEEFREVFSAFNATPGDYAGLGAERGPGFAVAGLDLRAGDADGLAGRIVFPTLVAGGGEELREDSADAALGMPRDLDGDGFVMADDVAESFVVLPVRIVVQWRGARGDRELELATVLSTR
jgi:type II secretory pathway pseudopilin PulG